ncbi:hypothetical protein C8F04DRAFT_1198696 [Mycena alexandri]|uniref:Uncharacterized protein n=1 Tax=Mycena alexandri TaxID=1745969 RepID=A0AAD6S1M7_9AGAR|nr:hypothetical protein C8F04DRAFT_1198696 [Mycena alexandri]
MIYINDSSGDIESMLREVVPPPTKTAYNLNPCPFGHDHCFELHTGELNECRIGSWPLFCTASNFPIQAGLNPPIHRCATQHGPLVPAAEMQLLWQLRDAYRPRNNALHEVQGLLQQLHTALGCSATLGDFPALPERTAQKTVSMLEECRDGLEGLAPHLLPRNPEVLEHIGIRVLLSGVHFTHLPSGKGKGKAKEFVTEWPLKRPESPLFDYDSDDDPLNVVNNDALNPDKDELSIIYPHLGRLVHLVIYTAAGAPYHTFCWTPTAMFRLSAYTIPGTSPTTKFLLYLVKSNERYAPAEAYINVKGLGNLLVYRVASLNHDSCLRIAKWEQRAREAAQQDATHPVGQAGPSRWSSPATTPDAPTPIKKPTIEAPSQPPSPSSLKRHASPLALTAPKKQKIMAPSPAEAGSSTAILPYHLRIQSYGNPDQPAFEVRTSDPDYSSDVEIVE